MESLAPVLCEGMTTPLNFATDALTLIIEPERVRRRAEDPLATSEEFRRRVAGGGTGGRAPLDVSAVLIASLAEMRDQATDLGLAWWTFAPFGMAETD